MEFIEFRINTRFVLSILKTMVENRVGTTDNDLWQSRQAFLSVIVCVCFIVSASIFIYIVFSPLYTKLLALMVQGNTSRVTTRYYFYNRSCLCSIAKSALYVPLIFAFFLLKNDAQTPTLMLSTLKQRSAGAI